MHISIGQFGGIAPAIDPEAIAEGMATTALDCALSSGKLVPLHENEVVEDLGAEGHKSLYRWEYREHKLTCGAAGDSTAAHWVALSDPAFAVSIDGTEYQVAPDFTDAADMDDVAEDIQDAIREQTEGIERVVWLTDRFVVWCNGDVTVLSAPDDGGATDISGSAWMNGVAGTLDNGEKESWLSWEEHADVVRSSVAADQYSRIYWTGGGGRPQVKGYDAGQTKTYDMAIHKPEKIPVIETVPIFVFTAFKANSVAASSFSRDGSKYSFSIDLGSTYYAANMYHSITISGVSAGGTLYYHKKLKFLISSTLNMASLSRWVESLGSDSELTDEETGSVARMEGSVSFELASYSSVTDGGSPPEVLGWNMEWHVSAEVEIVGTFPPSPAESFPRYLYSYVTEWGEEGPVSEPSIEIARQIGENVKVWMPVELPDGGAARGIVKKRVYVTDGNGDWRFCKDVDLDDSGQAATANAALDGTDDEDDGVLTWEYGLDNVPVESLGEVLEADVQPPDDELAGLCRLPGGYFSAFKGREVWISLPYRPEAWPEGYRFIFHDEIVTIKPSGNELFVLTVKTPWLLSGSEPQYMTQTQIMHDDRALTARGTVQVRGAVLSPGPDGLSAFVGGGATMATDGLLDAATWAGYSPTELLAATQDGAYVGFLAASGFMFVPTEGRTALTTLGDEGITAAFRDDETDNLYVIDADGQLAIWNSADEDCREMAWRSRDFIVPKPMRWVVAKVRAQQYAGKVTLKLYGDGVLRCTYVPVDAQARKIPVHARCHRWALEVVATATVYEIAVATSMAEVPHG